MNFCEKFLRIPFFIEHLRWLLLKNYSWLQTPGLVRILRLAEFSAGLKNFSPTDLMKRKNTFPGSLVFTNFSSIRHTFAIYINSISFFLFSIPSFFSLPQLNKLRRTSFRYTFAFHVSFAYFICLSFSFCLFFQM